MNDRPYPRVLVETCGLCVVGCGVAPGVCERLLEEVETYGEAAPTDDSGRRAGAAGAGRGAAPSRADFYRRVAAELAAEVPELHELQQVYGRGARRPSPRAQEG